MDHFRRCSKQRRRVLANAAISQTYLRRNGHCGAKANMGKTNLVLHEMAGTNIARFGIFREDGEKLQWRVDWRCQDGEATRRDANYGML